MLGIVYAAGGNWNHWNHLNMFRQITALISAVFDLHNLQSHMNNEASAKHYDTHSHVIATLRR
jgi:hypothetical protein